MKDFFGLTTNSPKAVVNHYQFHTLFNLRQKKNHLESRVSVLYFCWVKAEWEKLSMAFW